MQISLFLKKFENLIHDKAISKKIVCEILYQNIKKEVDQKNIKIVKNILYINTDTFTKNTIFFKKTKILEDLKKGTNLNITEIK
jgi:hypothetical protein